MKKIFIAIGLLMAFSRGANAQLLQPVSWSYAAKKMPDNTAIVMLKASIDDGWHIYSQAMAAGGPVKTVFTFAPSKAHTLIGKTIEPKPHSVFEKVFGMQVSYFEKQVVFKQKIKLKAAGATTVKGTLEYMTCNDKQCLPPETVEFSIPVK